MTRTLSLKQQLLLLLLLLLVLDQLTKQFALDAAIGTAPQLITRILPFFNIVLVWNSGVSFGMFSDFAQWMPFVLIVATGLMTVALAVWFWRASDTLTLCALACIMSGATGNIIDRIRFGAVVDFLDFHAFGYHWPAFNVADSSIFIGVMLLIWESLTTKQNA